MQSSDVTQRNTETLFLKTTRDWSPGRRRRQGDRHRRGRWERAGRRTGAAAGIAHRADHSRLHPRRSTRGTVRSACPRDGPLGKETGSGRPLSVGFHEPALGHRPPPRHVDVLDALRPEVEPDRSVVLDRQRRTSSRTIPVTLICVARRMLRFHLPFVESSFVHPPVLDGRLALRRDRVLQELKRGLVHRVPGIGIDRVGDPEGDVRRGIRAVVLAERVLRIVPVSRSGPRARTRGGLRVGQRGGHAVATTSGMSVPARWANSSGFVSDRDSTAGNVVLHSMSVHAGHVDGRRADSEGRLGTEVVRGIRATTAGDERPREPRYRPPNSGTVWNRVARRHRSDGQNELGLPDGDRCPGSSRARWQPRPAARSGSTMTRSRSQRHYGALERQACLAVEIEQHAGVENLRSRSPTTWRPPSRHRGGHRTVGAREISPDWSRCASRRCLGIVLGRPAGRHRTERLNTFIRRVLVDLVGRDDAEQTFGGLEVALAAFTISGGESRRSPRRWVADTTRLHMMLRPPKKRESRTAAATGRGRRLFGGLRRSSRGTSQKGLERPAYGSGRSESVGKETGRRLEDEDPRHRLFRQDSLAEC